MEKEELQKIDTEILINAMLMGANMFGMIKGVLDQRDELISRTISKEEAEKILEMGEVCFNEGLLDPKQYNICKKLRDKYFPEEYNYIFNK